ncbi:MAG: fatty acid desaturase [Dehalococcoidia bacterium]
MSSYAELKGRLHESGVFRPQLAYYSWQAALSAVLLVLPFALLLLSPPLWVVLLDAGLLAVALTRLAFILHDAGHRQIFARPKHNDAVMLLMGFLTGSSASWWFSSHNDHHNHPNNLDLDPSTMLPILAFSEQQAKARSGVLAFVIRFQAYYFFPLLLLEALGARLASVMFLFAGRARSPRLEALGILAHFVVYGALLFTLLPVGQALLFIAVHQALFGLYMGSVFAPNHKGMLVTSKASRLDFLHRQVLTSRNIKPNPVVDFWLGGLNYQIEHHLFPRIPRNKLREARAIIKDFCIKNSVSYHETSLRQSYAEVLTYLHRVGAPLRRPSSVLDEVTPTV